jgi:hypothetical protein
LICHFLAPSVSGMDRLGVQPFPSVPVVDVKNHLLEHTNMTRAQVERVVDVVGVHMGDFADILATFLKEEGKDEKIVLKHLEREVFFLCHFLCFCQSCFVLLLFSIPL